MDVEHRHHRQHRVDRAQAEGVRQVDGKRMQQRRAVRVQHALRVAGGARGVAERRGGALVEARPVDQGRGGGEQRLVGDEGEAGERRRFHRRRRRCLVGEHHERVQRRAEPPGEPGDERQELRVDEKVGGAALAQDEGDLLGVEPGVHRVAHRAEAGHGIVRLQVAVIAPGQRGDPLARPDAAGEKRVGEAGGALGDVGIAVAHPRAVGADADDPRAAVVRGGVGEDVGNEELALLHQGVHGVLFGQRASARIAGAEM